MKPGSGDYVLYDSTWMTFRICRTSGMGNWWARGLRVERTPSPQRGLREILKDETSVLIVVALWLHAFVKSHRANTEKEAVSSEGGEHFTDKEKLGNRSNGNSWLEIS